MKVLADCAGTLEKLSGTLLFSELGDDVRISLYRLLFFFLSLSFSSIWKEREKTTTEKIASWHQG